MKRRIKLDLNEVAGSLGDLATFLPLAIGLITVNGVNATSLFLVAGALYIVSGWYYGLPIPVQPLKATSAIAIALAVPAVAISAAAFWAGFLFLIISLFRFDELLGKVFTRPVVRGIQLGLAVLLVQGGLKGVLGPLVPYPHLYGTSPWIPGVFIGMAVVMIVVLSRENRRYPATLVVIPFGVLAGGFLTSVWIPEPVAAGWIRPEMGLPLGADPYTVFVVLLLPQVPLTLANSIAATSDAAGTYYGNRAVRVTHRGLAATLGIGNLLSGLVGGMPLCHGSGGVTAHYRFGARTGGANLFIGTVFVLVALFFGRSIADGCRLLPSSVLGALLVYVGIQHARLLRDIIGFPREIAIALCIGLVTFATGNLAVSFAAGIVLEKVIVRFFPEATVSSQLYFCPGDRARGAFRGGGETAAVNRLVCAGTKRVGVRMPPSTICPGGTDDAAPVCLSGNPSPHIIIDVTNLPGEGRGMTVKNVLYALAVVVLTVSMPNVLHCEEAKVGSSQPATTGSSQPATTGSSQPATTGSSQSTTGVSGQPPTGGSGQSPEVYGFQGPGVYGLQGPGGGGSQPATAGDSKEPTGGGSNPPTGETGGK